MEDLPIDYDNDVKMELTKTFCHICSSEIELSQLLPADYMEGVENYHKMIFDCFKIDIPIYCISTENNYICGECTRRLQEANGLKSLIENSQEILQQNLPPLENNCDDITFDEFNPIKKESMNEGEESIDASDSDSDNEAKRDHAEGESSDEELIVDEFDVNAFVNVSSETSQFCSNFAQKSGPKRLPPPDAEPIAYFNLYFTSTLLKTIVLETNRQIEHLKQSKLPKDPHKKKWDPVTSVEMRAFLAVFLEMSITKRSKIAAYWTTSSRYIPWFGRMLSRNRFQTLLKFFQLADYRAFSKDRGDSNPCDKFSFLLYHANMVFRQYYVPHRELYIDESLSRQRLQLGIKYWMLRDAVTNYCLSVFCYQRNKSSNEDKETILKHGLKYLAVEKLLKSSDCLNKGYHLFTNISYTNVRLAESLFEKNTYLTGAIRRNRLDIPKEITSSEDGLPKYYRNNNILMCLYQSKHRRAALISTTNDTHQTVIVKKKGDKMIEKKEPNIVHNYNKYTAEKDESNKMFNFYLARSQRYWKKIVFDIFDKMVLNAFILYSHNCGDKKLTQTEFTSQIIDSIEKEWMKQRNLEQVVLKQKCTLEKLPGAKLRICVECSNKNGVGRKRSSQVCSQCKKGLHAICAINHVCK